MATPAEYGVGWCDGERACWPIDLQREPPRDTGALTIDAIVTSNITERRSERDRLYLAWDGKVVREAQSRFAVAGNALCVLSARSTSTRRARSSR
jgi:hypothetical protein